MREKYFCSYKQSLALKELGFDEECLGYYTEQEYKDKEGILGRFILLSTKLRGELVGHGTVKNSLFSWLKDNDRTSGELYILSRSVTAPLKSQAFEFFRNKFGFSGIPNQLGYEIYDKNHFDCFWGCIIEELYETYEEAENACIDKLIEITKQK